MRMLRWPAWVLQVLFSVYCGYVVEVGGVGFCVLFVCLFFLIEILGFVDLLENVVCQGFRCVSVVLLFPLGENQSVKQQLLILRFF